MRFFLCIILIALLSFAACLYFPWWSIALVSFIVTLSLPQYPGKAFLSAFISLFFLWGGLAFWISFNNDHNLASKMSLVIINSGSAYLILLITALLGALVAGMAALCASLIIYRKTM